MAIKSPHQIRQLFHKARTKYEKTVAKFTMGQKSEFTKVCELLDDLHKVAKLEKEKRDEEAVRGFENDKKTALVRMTKFNKGFFPKGIKKTEQKPKWDYWGGLLKLTKLVRALDAKDLDANETEPDLQTLDQVVVTKEDEEGAEGGNEWVATGVSAKTQEDKPQEEKPKVVLGSHYPNEKAWLQLLLKVKSMARGDAQGEAYQKFADSLTRSRNKALEDKLLQPEARNNYLHMLDRLEKMMQGQIAGINSSIDYESDQDTRLERTLRELEGDLTSVHSEQEAQRRQEAKTERTKRRMLRRERDRLPPQEITQTIENSRGEIKFSPEDANGLRTLAKDVSMIGTDKKLTDFARLLDLCLQTTETHGQFSEKAIQAWSSLQKVFGEYKADLLQKHGKDVEKQDLKNSNFKRFQAIARIHDQVEAVLRGRAQATEMIKQQAILVHKAVQNNRKTPGALSLMAVNQLEQLSKGAQLPGELQNLITQVLRDARQELAREADLRFQELPEQNVEARAELLLEFGGAKPPATKGQSDSFMIKGTNGKPSYFFKPLDGEAFPGVGWPKSGGAPRELVISKVSDQIAQDLGIDCRVPKVDFVTLEDESFREGTISQQTKRSGALVQGVDLGPNDPPHAGEWFAPGNILLDPGEQVDKMLQSLNKDDVQSIQLLNFLTLDLDCNEGNLLVSGTTPQLNPGETRLHVIDAGRKLPSPKVFRKGPGAMSSMFGYRPGSIMTGQSLLLQTPSANEPFSDEFKNKIDQLDPNKLVQGMHSAYSEVVNQAPEMANSVDPGSLELVRRSALFLKAAAKAAPALTLFEISQVYANGFTEIVDAPDEQQLTQAIQRAVRSMQLLKQLGGDDAVGQKGINYVELTVQQKANVLENDLSREQFENEDYQRLQRELADFDNYVPDGPGKLTDELQRPFSPQNYKNLLFLARYKREGGDLALKELLEGNEESYRREVSRPLNERFGSLTWKEYERYASLGGTEAFVRLIGQEAFDSDYRGKLINQVVRAFERALKEVNQN